MSRRIVALGVVTVVTLGAGISLAADDLLRPAVRRTSMLRPLIGSIRLSSTGTVNCADLGSRVTDPANGNDLIVAIAAGPSGGAVVKAQPASVGLTMRDLASLERPTTGGKRPSPTQGALASPQRVCSTAP